MIRLFGAAAASSSIEAPRLTSAARLRNTRKRVNPDLVERMTPSDPAHQIPRIRPVAASLLRRGGAAIVLRFPSPPSSPTAASPPPAPSSYETAPHTVMCHLFSFLLACALSALVLRIGLVVVVVVVRLLLLRAPPSLPPPRPPPPSPAPHRLAPPSQTGYTALMIAALNNQEGILTALVTAGARLDVQNEVGPAAAASNAPRPAHRAPHASRQPPSQRPRPVRACEPTNARSLARYRRRRPSSDQS